MQVRARTILIMCSNPIERSNSLRGLQPSFPGVQDTLWKYAPVRDLIIIIIIVLLMSNLDEDEKNFPA